MMSASKMSMMIREKKKKMREDRDVIDAGDSPSMDLQDVDALDRYDSTKELGLDHNEPEHVHEPDDVDRHEAEAHKDNLEHLDQIQSADDAGIEEKMLMRKKRIAKMMSEA